MDVALLVFTTVFSTVSLMGLDYLYSRQVDRLFWPAVSFVFCLLVSAVMVSALHALYV